MAKIVLKIKFLGTRYCGWQVQKNAVSVQETLQNAVEKVFLKRYGISGCSRTDSGVHANEYFCHIDDAPEFDVSKLPLALNVFLPEDIAVISAEYKDDDFHSRYSAKGKEYIYLIHNSNIKDPFIYGRAFQYGREIDTERAKRLSLDFVGTHDFTSFMSAHSKITDAVRNVYYFDIDKQGDMITFKVAADGFLYNMVRIMTGTLLCVLAGSVKMSIGEIIDKKDRSFAGWTAPAEGLYLNKVFY
ncbi:MAG: tRNA pseudouridine(38-40) synthase TruA [Clostridia bacterium]|nr:tRNA pseudouridine(38-40) synthase TruA [Clostridia bacterium]